MSAEGTPRDKTIDVLALHLRASRERASVGSDVDLLLDFHNTGDLNLVIGGFAERNGERRMSVAWLLRALVFDANGRALPTTGPTVKSGAEARLMPIEIGPGMTLRTAPLPVSTIQFEADGEWMDINSRSGTYMIELVYSLKPDQLEGTHWSGSIASNQVRLTFE
jgi:hypothetical protein